MSRRTASSQTWTRGWAPIVRRREVPDLGQAGDPRPGPAGRLVLGKVDLDAQGLGQRDRVDVDQDAVVAVGLDGSDEARGDRRRVLAEAALGEARLPGGHQEVMEHDRDPVGTAAFERRTDALITVHSCPPGRPDPALPG